MPTSYSPLPDAIGTEEQLDELLSRPSAIVYQGLKALDGDLVILGVSGKMGPTLARMAVRALAELDLPYRVYGVARFSQPAVREQLEAWGVHTIQCDLLDPARLEELPFSKHIVFMAGQKFGTTGNSELTWAINTHMPALVAQRYAEARIVVLSTGNVYPVTPVASGGPTEEMPPAPVGDYAASCLGRERIFEYFARDQNTPCAIMRLNYAVEMRYGVLVDIAQQVWAEVPINLEMGACNVIWQGDANARVLALLGHCSVPPLILNVTGPETVSVRYVAERFGALLGKRPSLQGIEAETALLSNAARAHHLFGYPTVALDRMLTWIADWIAQGGTTLGKPTHFEVRDGQF